MPSPRFPFPFLAALAAAFAFGWFGHAQIASSPVATSFTVPQVAAAVRALKPVSALTFPADAAQSFEAALSAPVTYYQRRGLLERSAGELDRSEVIAALERERTRASSVASDSILPTEALITRFAELDPAAAMLWIAQAYPGGLRYEWLNSPLGLWMEKDLKAALAWVDGLPSGSLRSRASAEVIQQLAATDPDKALQRLDALPDDRSFTASTVFSKLAAKDLTYACAQAARLPTDRMKGAVEGIAGFWAQDHPQEAYAWAARIAPGPVHDAAVSSLYISWAERDPAAAAAFLSKHGGANLSRYATQLVNQWAARDIAAARAWSEGLPPQVRGEALQQVVSAWSATDPRGAVAYAAALPKNMRDRALAQALTVWSQTDVNAAVAWIDQQAPAGMRSDALQSICQTWSMQDPRACAKYLSSQAGDQMWDSDHGMALQGWARESPEEVWQWGQSLTDEKRRGAAEAAALDALAERDPAAASARVEQISGEGQSDAAENVARTWMESDPVAAANWADALPEGDARASAISSVARARAAYDAPGTAAWLNGLPPGAARDQGIGSMLDGGTDGMQPMALVRLAQSVQDTEKRGDALSKVASDWLAADRAAATAWVMQCGEFTDEQRNDLLQTSEVTSGDGTTGPGLGLP